MLSAPTDAQKPENAENVTSASTNEGRHLLVECGPLNMERMTVGGGGNCGSLGAPVHPVSEAVPHGPADGAVMPGHSQALTQSLQTEQRLRRGQGQQGLRLMPKPPRTMCVVHRPNAPTDGCSQLTETDIRTVNS